MSIRSKWRTTRLRLWWGLQRHRLDVWVRTHALGLAAVSFVLLGSSVGLSAFATYRTGIEAGQRSAVDSARTAQLKWDGKNEDHKGCLRQAASRSEARKTFFDIFDSIAATATERDRDQVTAFVAESKARVAANLPELDCAELAPKPKGPRPVIPN